MKTEIIYGIHPVHEALAANRRNVYEVYIDKDKKSGRLAQLVSFAESRGVLQKNIGTDGFQALVKTRGHQGAAARVSPFPLTAVSEILESAHAEGARHFFLMLDNIQDPQNLGAIIRTALCIGIDGVILPKDRSAAPTPAVSKASSGALEHIRLTRVTNLVQTIKKFKKKGIWIIGLQKEAVQSVYSTNLTESLAIVIGGERKGIRPLVKKKCDFLVSIPQQGPVDSLNASVAAGIAMYEAFRQRQEK